MDIEDVGQPGSRRDATAATRLAMDVPDLVCLMHLRWDFVFQRPHHLLTRFAADRRVLWIEEPLWGPSPVPRLDVHEARPGVTVVVPHLPDRVREHRATDVLRGLLDDLFADRHLQSYVLWYYTPMALAFTDHLAPQLVVYDCMDDLASFNGAPALVGELEAELFRRADLAFTGGYSLFEEKKNRHHNIHPFPSSIDVAHFRHAREAQADPLDQAGIPHPRLGYFGVIDERIDLDLLRGVAACRPEWHLVLLGPLAKIDDADLPRAPNIHYLGKKPYEQLARYIAGWDVAILPFARNDATRFISPTKTPEYLAAGRPVVSTSIRDVVRPYGEQQVARIADTVGEFVVAAERAMSEDRSNPAWLCAVDRLLAGMSWDLTWTRMSALYESTLAHARGNGGTRAKGRSRSLIPARPTHRSYGEVEPCSTI